MIVYDKDRNEVKGKMNNTALQELIRINDDVKGHSIVVEKDKEIMRMELIGHKVKYGKYLNNLNENFNRCFDILKYVEGYPIEIEQTTLSIYKEIFETKKKIEAIDEFLARFYG